MVRPYTQSQAIMIMIPVLSMTMWLFSQYWIYMILWLLKLRSGCVPSVASPKSLLEIQASKTYETSINNGEMAAPAMPSIPSTHRPRLHCRVLKGIPISCGRTWNRTLSWRHGIEFQEIKPPLYHYTGIEESPNFERLKWGVTTLPSQTM